MAKVTITITIKETGDVSVEAAHVKGAGCAKLTEGIERAIGKTVSDVKKPEFLQAAETASKTAREARQ